MKIHLGCGKRFLPGYVHVDTSSYPHIDYIHDVKTLPMFQDDSVELIYASHVLEYFDRTELATVLKEWHRVLCFDGILRLAVPNIEALIDVYIKSKDLNKILGPLYGKWYIGNGNCIYHKTVYDYESLSRMLILNNFANVRRWNWKEVFVGELAEFDDYSKAYIPHLDFDNGTLISLNVECIKV